MKFLERWQWLFWDFDGVIKDSIDVKTQAFLALFPEASPQLLAQIRVHHEGQGGMSRYQKIPLYLTWAGIEPTEARILDYSQKFGAFAFQGVVEAPWIPGVEAYLRGNPHRQNFVMISATPQPELEEILAQLDLKPCFREIFGAPTPKKEAIRRVLSTYQLQPQECLMIGDARVDWEAAQANQIAFLLRRHSTNAQVFEEYSGPAVEDFREVC